jgi:Tfp pilus assembly protein PilO
MPAFDYKKEYDRYKRYYLSVEPLFNKPANRAYTTVIFSFLAISLFGWYAIRPTMQTIFTLKREITDRTGIDVKMEDKISSLIEAQAAYQNIEPNLPLIAQALPTTSDPIQAVNQIQKLADDSNVQMTVISVPALPLTNYESVKKQDATSTLSNYTISVTIVGPYSNVKNFVSMLANIRRIIQIDSMMFIPQQNQEQASESATPVTPNTTVEVNLKLIVYYLSS